MIQPFFENTSLFTAGEAGYMIYRIPGIVATPTGILLACCEARRNDWGDWCDIDLFLRRSTDGGSTWSAPVKMNPHLELFTKNQTALQAGVTRADEQTYNNPVLIASREPGVVHFLYCVEYLRCFHRVSYDDGLTWSQPVEITAAFEELRRTYDWQVIAVGPGHGFQLSTGRLLAPTWLSLGTGSHPHRPSAVSTLYSDDGGASWQAGEIITADGTALSNPSEAVLVELADGQVLANIRSESPLHRRAVSKSPDGAQDWSSPELEEALFEPVCFASLQRLSLAPPHRKNRLLFANPDSRQAGELGLGWNAWERKNLTVRLSYDEGQTWPIARVIDPGVAGYSDLSVDPQGGIHCLYERGCTDGNPFAIQSLILARFNLAWLTNGKETDL